MIRKKFINNVDSVVDDCLNGVVVADSCLTYHPKNPRIILRRDLSHITQRGCVSFAVGGGSGHEPFSANLVGKNGSSAAICGDRLNFGMGLERLKAKLEEPEARVGLVYIDDDVSLEGQFSSTTGRRGLAGGMLILHMVGVMAEVSHMQFDAIYNESQRMIHELGTFGISLYPCSLPGRGYLFEMPENELEFGQGIHGEPGIERRKVGSAHDIVHTVMERLVNSKRLALNNDTSTPLAEILNWLIARKYIVLRFYCGSVTTSLDAHGVSVSILKIVDNRWLELLDTPGKISGLWQTSIPSRHTVVAPQVQLKQVHVAIENIGVQVSLTTANHIKTALLAACNALIHNSDLLNSLDSVVGDGDCGDSLKNAGTTIINFANSGKLNFARPKALCLELSDLCEQAVGGTSGALYALFFSAASNAFGERFDEKQLRLAIKKGLWSIEYFGRARPGNRTMVDALCAASQANPNDKWSDIVKSVEQGAENTASMQASSGRASYTAKAHQHLADPGAKAVAIWFRAAYESLANYLEKMVSLEGTEYWELERLRDKVILYNHIKLRNQNNPQSRDVLEQELSDVTLPDEEEFFKDRTPDGYADLVTEIKSFVLERFKKSDNSANTINKNLIEFCDKNQPTTSTLSAQRIVFDLLQKAITETPQTFDELAFLDNLSVSLKSKITQLESIKTISGNHPIIVMSFKVGEMTVAVDLSVQNHKTVLNSYIIRQYTRIDRRFVVVFNVIKRWAKTNHMFGGSNNRFNSYALALLVIQYLQSGIKPAVLPYLNKGHPELFAENASVNDIRVDRDLNVNFKSKNKMTVLQLVAGFLLFYNEFEFEKYMPSILDPIHQNRFNRGNFYCPNPMIIIDPCFGCNPAREVNFITFIQFKQAIENFIELCKRPNNESMATHFNIMFGMVDDILVEDLPENMNLRIESKFGFLLICFGRLIKILVPVYSDYSTNRQISQDRYAYLFGVVPRRMTASFDENNPKYWVFFKKLHIRVAARGVSIALLLLVAIDLIQSFRHSTAVILYSWLAACFAIGIYASLMYGVFKEKRLFVMPFLIFQAVMIAFLSITLFIFTASALFSPSTLKKASEREQASQLRGFVVYFYIILGFALGLQLWFMEIIYRFFHFLKERETCFNFNLENEFQLHD
ncbi:Bifunctional ATP-dependent dihydroxyacetone kinase/FAD-AMP lyase [Aphelenchoides bicaudatus]|nr:Bifunctional ATP-dependent dihydroxyacetone kinase/FAD-AMP lyase [Aphelenchoides bicaudatus]